MKKACMGLFVIALLSTGYIPSAEAYTGAILTNGLPSASAGVYYSTRVKFISDSPSGTVTFTVSNLPPGIGIMMSTSYVGYVSVHGVTQQEADSTYYVEITGTPTTTGTYNLNVRIHDPVQSFDASKTLTLRVHPAPPTGPAHAENTNILGTDGTVYRIQSGHKSPYTSAGAFLSYRFNKWSEVVTATTGDMALPLTTYTPYGSTQTTTFFIPPRNGSLINDNGTVYLMTNGTRIGFANAESFLGLGYSFATVIPGDTSFMVTNLQPIGSQTVGHPTGSLINDNGTIYYISNSLRLGIPSMAVFNSWGFELNEVVSANIYDRQLPEGGLMNIRMANQMNP